MSIDLERMRREARADVDVCGDPVRRAADVLALANEVQRLAHLAAAWERYARVLRDDWDGKDDIRAAYVALQEVDPALRAEVEAARASLRRSTPAMPEGEKGQG